MNQRSDRSGIHGLFLMKGFVLAAAAVCASGAAFPACSGDV